MRISDWSSDVCSSDLLRACEKSLTRAKRYHERNAVSEVRTWASRNVANYIEKAGEARAGFARAFEALGQEQPSPGLLSFYAGLARIGDGKAGYAAANRATSQLSKAAQQNARAALSAARDLPQAELRGRIGPEAANRADTARVAVRDRIVADIEGIQPSMAGHDAVANLRRGAAEG